MRHLRTYEEVDWDDYNKRHYHNGIFYPGGTDGPLIGYYVVIKNDDNLRIGKITEVDKNAPFNFFKVYLELEKGSEEQRKFWFDMVDIVYYSKDREDCVMYLETKKFNL